MYGVLVIGSGNIQGRTIVLLPTFNRSGTEVLELNLARHGYPTHASCVTEQDFVLFMLQRCQIAGSCQILTTSHMMFVVLVSDDGS